MKTISTVSKNILLIMCLSFVFCVQLQAQLKLKSTGRVQVGEDYSFDYGWLQMGNDGANRGIAFYDASTGGVTARMFRINDIFHITRGVSTGVGLRIKNNGHVAIGTNSERGSSYFGNASLSLFREGDTSLVSYTVQNFDDGDAQKSVVSRPRTAAYAVWYNGNKTCWIHGSGEIYSKGLFLRGNTKYALYTKTLKY